VKFVVENNSSKKEMEVLIQEDLIEKKYDLIEKKIDRMPCWSNTVNKVTSRHSQMY
jgi:hypothetical protein